MTDLNDKPTVTLRTHRDSDTASPNWLVKRLLPQRGIGLFSGQWGTGKTAVIIDLAGALSAKDGTFAGLPIKRKGVLLLFTLEGADIVQSRLEALSREKYDGRNIDIYFTDEQVKLLDKSGVDRVIEIAQAASRRAKHELNRPLVAVAFDTVMMAAGYAGEGAEQDNVIGAKIMQALRKIEQATGALVIGVDHYGKQIESGTRGGSAKEDTADFVIALLGERELNGKVTNRRMVIRKIRSSAAGVEYPFNLKDVEIGLDEDGEPDSSIVVDWNTAPSPIKLRISDSKRSNAIRNIVVNLINDGWSEDRTPFADMKPIKCVRLDAVRTEFYRQYIGRGDADPKKVQEAKKKACQRAMEAAQDNKIISVRDDWCWII
jgi:hypothetical protein